MTGLEHFIIDEFSYQKTADFLYGAKQATIEYDTYDYLILSDLEEIAHKMSHGEICPCIVEQDNE